MNDLCVGYGSNYHDLDTCKRLNLCGKIFSSDGPGKTFFCDEVHYLRTAYHSFHSFVRLLWNAALQVLS